MSSATSRVERFLRNVERRGNRLPHPATLFAMLSVAVAVASWFAAHLGLSTVHPATGETIAAFNLLGTEGLHRVLVELVSNLTGFAPLGAVLVSLIGIGVAEHSGLIGAALRRFLYAVPSHWVTPGIVFAGVMSNLAAEVGYVVLIPLAGLIMQGAGRHPIVGMAAAFAGVSGGYSANLLLGSFDPLLAGVSQEAARLVDPGYTVNAAANWFFMMASTPLVVVLGTWVTNLAIAPRFTHLPDADPRSVAAPPDANERRGLRWAGIAFLLLGAWVAWGLVPADGFLREAGTGSVVDSPFMHGIVALIFLSGVVGGLAFGFGAGTLRSDQDVLRGMTGTMSTMGGYVVLVFFAAQFVAFFEWSQLGLIVALQLGEWLRFLDLPPVLLFLGIVATTGFANLFIGSASAKWALLAPVFVPMCMLLGYSPEAAQAAYRVGDSVTNLLSPTMAYFALVIACFQRHDPKAGFGTVVSVMLPYSIVFAIGWSLLLVLWIVSGWPLGPGAPLTYPA